MDKLALLMGGDSPEAGISRQGAGCVADALRALGIDFALIDVADGRALSERLRRRDFSCAFNLVHGEFGEDGTLLALLEHFAIAHTGAPSSAAMLCFDKNLCKSIWRAEGLPTPDWSLLADDAAADTPAMEFPLVCKPVRSGSSLGVEIVGDGRALSEARLRHRRYGRLMAERYAGGREYSTGFVQGQLLPTIELVVPGKFYDYHAKYQSEQTQYLPAPHIDSDQAVVGILDRAFRALNCRGWGRIDFICDERKGVQLLEINPVPGMGTHSLLPKAAALAGYAYEETVGAILADVEPLSR